MARKTTVQNFQAAETPDPGADFGNPDDDDEGTPFEGYGAPGHGFVEPPEIIADATRERTPRDKCGECGYDRKDHADFDAAAIRKQEPLPGMPPPVEWGLYEGIPITSMMLGFQGIKAPAALAGRLKHGSRFKLVLECAVGGSSEKVVTTEDGPQARCSKGLLVLGAEVVEE